ncbi:16S rRNA (guanine(966)-N(2))-methyltransferase RsmD [Zhongshania sp.]|uniref:16S rRNA (guanine(966)-N(2))-methyltransferase RsmD n=1 Tax=Zhongshania sp. TaxID=1971902 RepID=UPI0035685766
MPKTPRNTAAQTSANTRQQGSLRIIGGQWRSRKLHFEGTAGLRPTSDRIRETLFNWLNPTIHGARCLDLFAGSGALGLEALSRYAAHCDFIDTDRNSCQEIRQQLENLRCPHATVHCKDALAFLNKSAQSYNIIFLDPPFHMDLLAPVITALASHALKPNTQIYIETANDEALPALPANWQIDKEKKAGQVIYRLISVAEEPLA